MMMTLIKKIAGYLAFLAVVTGIYAWLWGIPWLKELNAKMPHRFQTVVAEFKALHWVEMARIIEEIDALTPEEARRLRYLHWKETFESDEAFRKKARDDETAARKASIKGMNQRHATELESFRTESGASLPWKKQDPWVQSIKLREKCRKYLNREQALAGKTPQNFRSVSAEVADRCSDWVPLSQDKETVEKSLYGLKDRLDYFYFVSLLDELGYSSSDIFELEDGLNRMTQSFIRR